MSKLINIEDVSAYFVPSGNNTDIQCITQFRLTNLPSKFTSDKDKLDRQKKLARALEKAIKAWEIEIE